MIAAPARAASATAPADCCIGLPRCGGYTHEARMVKLEAGNIPRGTWGFTYETELGARISAPSAKECRRPRANDCKEPWRCIKYLHGEMEFEPVPPCLQWDICWRRGWRRWPLCSLAGDARCEM